MKADRLTDKIKKYALLIKPYLKNIRWICMSTVTTMYWYLNSRKYILPDGYARKSFAKYLPGKIYLNVRHALREYDFLAVILIFLIYLLYSKTPKYNGSRAEKGVAVFFSGLIPFLTIMCQSYDKGGNWNYLFGTDGAVILSTIKIVGFGMLIYSALCFLSHKTFTVQKKDGLRKPFNFSKDVIVTAVIIFLLWAPYYYLLYPGCFTPDGKDQLAQAINDPLRSWSAMGINLIDPNVIINTHHPVIYTYILKITVAVAKAINSYSRAFGLLCLCQAALFALSIAYLISTLKRYGARRGFIIGTFLFFVVNPIFPSYAMTIIKDTIHMAFMIFAFVMTYEMLTLKKITAKRIAVYFAVMLLFALTRNNVVYVLAAVLICAVISLRRDKSRMLKTAPVVLAVILTVTVGFGMIIYPALHISKGSSREMLAVPINQTARYVVEHRDEITPEEEEVILRIFSNNDVAEGTSLDIIAENYDPVLSDPVKDMYDKDTDINDLKDYFRVWFAQFKKHPDTYVQAYLNIHYGWFSYEGHNQIAYSRVESRHISRMIKEFKNHMGSEFRRNIVNYYESVLIKIPLTVPFLETATYTWLYIALLVYMIKHKKHNALLTCSLVYFNYLIYFAGPVAYLRYSMQMVCVAPFAIFTALSKNESRMEDL